ncbi:thiamine pyrophosphate-binding protein [Teredinibacter turnerae]|uniref:thiamine pyrophosphate-binding protein n=1 Tax=Teredinibacter turnerae TaxID=2426 RepID=UPI00041AEBCB|nr:thiamine pyrophosphate-binding protein [Teredinibacter turnerae]
MKEFFTNEKNCQVVISLLKQHGIRKIIASPGTTNTAFVVSIQRDKFFLVYSAVDERSAAYMAVGMSIESNEPVVLSCTGATASRNYLPGLTEAFYRKIPVLAITSCQKYSSIGHHVAQVVDRSKIPNDVARASFHLPIVKDQDDLWDCEVKVNSAILELTRSGGGPVHINLPTTYEKPFSTRVIPTYRMIKRYRLEDDLPKLKGRVAIFVGSHKKWDERESACLSALSEHIDAPVFCDHTSGYFGANRLLYSIAASQTMFDHSAYRPDIFIHIGEISGDYPSLNMAGREIWRVSEDGEIRDTFKKLKYVFEMGDEQFFCHYKKTSSRQQNGYFRMCADLLEDVRQGVPDLPFSNIWLASKLSGSLPKKSIVHLGILNSLRSWNFFELDESINASSNVGGFGIDGCLSTLIGASLVDRERLAYMVIGDLAFFYDMNILGNRHIDKNVRVLVINNGTGAEFKQYSHHAAYFGDTADELVSATGHFGQKSRSLVRGFAESLGFEYFSASSKGEFEECFEKFVEARISDKPIIVEAFTDAASESIALELMNTIKVSAAGRAKEIVKKVLGEERIKTIKNVVKSNTK